MSHFVIENEIYETDVVSVSTVVSEILSDDEVSDLESRAISWDEDGEPDEWEIVYLTDQEWLDACGGHFIDDDESVERAAVGEAVYHGVSLKERIAVELADPDYLKVKETFKAMLDEKGWVCVWDKNNSAYFEKERKCVRVSNHRLGLSWTGRPQTGGADFDLVWEKGQTAEDLMNEFIEISEE